ncbi:zinc-ribbon domain-containing protein [Spongisporangium articulatum]|uniref:Zinc-ribbon domain-containing protein n=1 Tax=Spongisporangium articulatum TaxID=3362603 RepID=A0ABW8ATW6_9ACTN
MWGWKTYVRLLGVMTFVCASCHNPAAQRAEQQVRKFTLFWVPLIPIGKKTTLTCTYCGVTTVVPKEHVEQLMADLETAGSAPPAQRPVAAPDALPGPPPASGTPRLPDGPNGGRHRA